MKHIFKKLFQANKFRLTIVFYRRHLKLLLMKQHNGEILILLVFRLLFAGHHLSPLWFIKFFFNDHVYIYVQREEIGLVCLFNGISTFIGFLTLKLFS